ncbi:MAG: DMT family transporter [Oscillospiraceae bacterium]|nr:DMT family transporter [Oscillospiraceae bacterium]
MKQAYLKLISGFLLFGSNGIVASYILLTSYEVVFSRTLIGSLFLIMIHILSKGKFRSWENKKHFCCVIVSGAAMSGSWMFLYEAYKQIGVSVATLAYYCGPVIVMALSPLVFRERLTKAKIFGLFAVLTGMLLVNGSDLLRGGFSWGLFCGVMSAFMYALMVICNKKAASITGLENSMWQLTVSFFAVAVFMLIKQGAAFPFPLHSILPILFLGVVNTGIGCYLYFSSIHQLPVQSVAILGYLEPLSALIFSAALLQERLSFIQAAGAVLILGGAAFGEFFHFHVKKG